MRGLEVIMGSLQGLTWPRGRVSENRITLVLVHSTKVSGKSPNLQMRGMEFLVGA